MSEKITDEWLRENLVCYCQDMLASLPHPEDLDPSPFSSSFEQKMRKLLRRREASYWPLVSSVGRRVATVVLAFLLASSCLMSVEAIRVPVVHFFVEVYETFSRISFEGDEGAGAGPETIEELYLPSEIPEGFVLEEELREDSFSIFRYVKGDEWIDWSQYCMGFAHHVDTEGIKSEKVESEGIHYFYYSNKGIQDFIWEENGYVFSCAGTLSRETLFMILQSAQKTF